MSSVKRQKLMHSVLVDDRLPSHTRHGGEVQKNKPISARTGRAYTITSDMYGKDIVQMQAEEMLEELDLSRQRCFATIDLFLDNLRTTIESIPPKEPSNPVNAGKLLWRESKVSVPFPDPRPEDDVRYTVCYKRPVEVKSGGSFALNTSLVTKRSLPIIDLNAMMPTELFHPKDYFDLRYFHKRAYYIACIAAGLSRSENVQASLHFDFLDGNNMLPVLIIVPSEMVFKFQVRIRPLLQSEIFPTDKLFPFEDSIQDKSEEGERHRSAANSLYCSTIRADCSTVMYSELLQSVASTTAFFSQACVLLKVWLSQRGMDSALHKGGFGGFEASILMALLLRGGGIKDRPFLSSGYNAVQLFKAMLQFLSKRDLIAEPMIDRATSDLRKDLKNGSQPVLWDADRGLNLFYKMTISSYSFLRHQARLTISNLHHETLQAFRATFLQNVTDSSRLYDDSVSLKIPKSMADKGQDGKAARIGISLSQSVFENLQKALGIRATLIHVIPELQEAWPGLRKPVPKVYTDVNIGLLLDPVHYNRIVDRGPAGEDAEAAAAYRKFWGPKSELRRFQDGTIVESIIWQRGQRIEAVHRQIVRYICNRMFEISITWTGWEPYIHPGLQPYASDSLDRTNSALKVFDEIKDKIRSLNKLPLRIREFTPTCLVLDENQHGSARQDVLDTLLQFESSARWPEDMTAIQRTKIALLVNISQLLMEGHESVSCLLALDEQATGLHDAALLEIRQPGRGNVIRVRTHHDRETELVSSRLVKARSAAERQALVEIESSINRTRLRRPAHFQAVRQIGLRMPMLLPSIMLFKKWCSSHLLTSHMTDELTELLVIHTFTSSYPYSPPSNTTVALLRVLDFLASWNWRLEPLAVKINEDVGPEQQAEIDDRFRAWRKLDPNFDRLAVFAASNIETDGTFWTKQGPSKAVISRLVSLARAAVSLVTIGTSPSDVAKLFATGLADYDFVVYLNPQYTAAKPLNYKQEFKNLQLQEYGSDRVPAALAPAWKFVQDISLQYADVLALFHDRARRPIVGGLWTPRSGARSWKLGLDYSSKPLPPSKGQDTEANRDAILSDIARLGADLIEKIEVNSSN